MYRNIYMIYIPEYAYIKQICMNICILYAYFIWGGERSDIN